jgi:Zn-dependent alcohol dehydrogenase
MAIRDQIIAPMPQPIVLGPEGAGTIEAGGAKAGRSRDYLRRFVWQMP